MESFSPQLVNVDSNIESGAERAPEHQLFGTRFSKRVDYFAFPRTGSHYLSYLLTGVMDLVFFKIAGQDAPEVASRVHELKADVLYSLKLREDGVPFQPVYLRHAPLGIHEKPQLKDDLMIVLVRDPRAAIFSWYRLHVDRLQVRIEDPISWLQCEFDRYRDFYQSAASVCAGTTYTGFDGPLRGPRAISRLTARDLSIRRRSAKARSRFCASNSTL